MLVLSRYGGREEEAEEDEEDEEQGAADSEGDMEKVVGGAVEKPAGSEDEDGVLRAPFLVADCLSRSEPAEEKMLCRSASP